MKIICSICISTKYKKAQSSLLRNPLGLWTPFHTRYFPLLHYHLLFLSLAQKPISCIVITLKSKIQLLFTNICSKSSKLLAKTKTKRHDLTD